MRCWRLSKPLEINITKHKPSFLHNKLRHMLCTWNVNFNSKKINDFFLNKGNVIRSWWEVIRKDHLSFVASIESMSVIIMLQWTHILKVYKKKGFFLKKRWTSHYKHVNL